MAKAPAATSRAVVNASVADVIPSGFVRISQHVVCVCKLASYAYHTELLCACTLHKRGLTRIMKCMSPRLTLPPTASATNQSKTKQRRKAKALSSDFYFPQPRGTALCIPLICSRGKLAIYIPPHEPSGRPPVGPRTRESLHGASGSRLGGSPQPSHSLKNATKKFNQAQITRQSMWPTR